MSSTSGILTHHLLVSGQVHTTVLYGRATCGRQWKLGLFYLHMYSDPQVGKIIRVCTCE